jgi:LacI family transcriptional regulator
MKCYNEDMKRVLVASTIKGIAGRNCLSGVFDYVNEGCDWSIRFLQDQQSLGAREVGSVIEGGIDGVIACLRELDDSYRLLAESGVPMVQIHDPDPDRAISRSCGYAKLLNDDVATGRLAARHFLEHGAFNSFGFIPTDGRTAWSVRRERGFRLELAQLSHVVLTPRGRTLEAFLASMPKPAAVFCATDVEAVNALAVCRKLRLRVPHQIAVLGVDDDEILCESCRPSLSSIKTDDFALGRRAARELDRMMRNSSAGAPRPILVAPDGVAVRDSTRTVSPTAHLIREGLSFIRRNVSSGITVKDVVRHLGVSPSLARSRFASVHGKSIRDVILDERLSVAKRLLRTTHAPIDSVARRSGFESACRMSHFFSERLGMSPSAWRKGDSE